MVKISKFGGLKLTSAGMELLAKSQLGKKINFSRVGIGSGDIEQVINYLTFTSLINEKLSLNIDGIDFIGENQARIKTYLSNAEITEGFYFTEIGVFATNPDNEEEILYAYANCGNTGDYIPANTDTEIVEKIINIIVTIYNKELTSAVLDKSTIRDFNIKWEDESTEEVLNTSYNKVLTREKYEQEEKQKDVFYYIVEEQQNDN